MLETLGRSMTLLALAVLLFVPANVGSGQLDAPVLRKVDYGSMEPPKQLFRGKCTQQCQEEFDKCIEKQMVKTSCDNRLYKITGVRTYEFPCSKNDIWLMEYSEACHVKGKGDPASSSTQFTGQMTCLAVDAAKKCDALNNGCAVDCVNSSKIDRDFGIQEPPNSPKRGTVRPAADITDIRRE